MTRGGKWVSVVLLASPAAVAIGVSGKNLANQTPTTPVSTGKAELAEVQVEVGLSSLARVQVIHGLSLSEEVALEDPTGPKKKES